MRKLIAHAIAAIAGKIYGLGVDLYRVSDWVYDEWEPAPPPKPLFEYQSTGTNLTNMSGSITTNTWAASGEKEN